jgi:hypothetical protein
MSKLIVRRLIVALALSALLGSPATSLAAAPRPASHHSRAQAAAKNPLSRLWNSLVRAWEKNGCEADPYGRCLPASQTSTDNGCGLDPYGQCTPSH